jgi:hypothetical protein
MSYEERLGWVVCAEVKELGHDFMRVVFPLAYPLQIPTAVIARIAVKVIHGVSVAPIRDELLSDQSVNEATVSLTVPTKGYLPVAGVTITRGQLM